MSQQPILVPLSPAELIDKITILEIKSRKIQDPANRAHVETELRLLQATREQHIEPRAELDRLAGRLREVNETLWQVEDEIRSCDAAHDFGPQFVELARQVYRQNDERARLKREINLLLGSELIEQKQYSRGQTL